MSTTVVVLLIEFLAGSVLLLHVLILWEVGLRVRYWLRSVTWA